MNPALLELGLRLEAARRDCLLPRVNRAQVSLGPKAILMSVVVMPGTHAALWAVGISKMDSPGNVRVLSVPEPRDSACQNTLWSALADRLGPWADECVALGVPPQLVSAVPEAWNVIDANAERMVNSPNAAARRGAEVIRFISSRGYIKGSQCRIVATELLSQHFVTGCNSDAEQELMTWLNANQATRDHHPDSSMVWTPVELDRYVLDPAVERYRHDKNNQRNKDEIQKTLEKLISTRHRALQAAVRIYTDAELPYISGVAYIARLESEALARYMDSRHQGFQVARSQTPLNAAIDLAEREDAQTEWDRTLIWEDDRHSQWAIAKGEIIQGTVTSIGTGHMSVLSTQPELRTRPNDKLCVRGQEKISGVVITLQKTTDQTIIDLTMHNIGTVSINDTVVLCAGPGDAATSARTIKRLRTRYGRHPSWIHSSRVEAPDIPSKPVPEDPLLIARGLRRDGITV